MGRKKREAQLYKICYGNKFKKYDLLKIKEGVTAKVILKVN